MNTLKHKSFHSLIRSLLQRKHIAVTKQLLSNATDKHKDAARVHQTQHVSIIHNTCPSNTPRVWYRKPETAIVYRETEVFVVKNASP